jgi:carbamoyl-phosphate synthase large subunit
MSHASQPCVLITGAGGAAAVTLITSLAPSYRVIAGDIDPLAAGLYLVPAAQRVLLPRGDDPAFADVLLEVARRCHADLVIPTVDVELPVVAAKVGDFERAGVAVLVESSQTLERCQDKLTLVGLCQGSVRVPRTVLLERTTSADELERLGLPFIVKPRLGAGGRGFAVISSGEDLHGVPRDGTMLAQEHLPGEEFSIDVLARPDGHVVAAVPRRRDKVDSGIAVAGRTVRDPELEDFGRSVARLIGATGVVNVQARRAVDGTPALLEVNARFPGTMALTQAAGVDMPVLAARAALGHPLPDHLDFEEVAVVRHLADVTVPLAEYTTMRDGRTHPGLDA